MSTLKTYFYYLLVLAFSVMSSISFADAQASGYIKIYFNNPVNTTLSTGSPAVYLDQTMDDSLVAYINRAQYTLDIAVYNYVQSSGMASISGAVNNAYNRGVRVRWIHDGNASNSGLSQLNLNIRRLGSPTGSNYGIMHNKFVVIDAHSVIPTEPVVWTGSCNWDRDQFDIDVNNTVIIQDRNLALAYTTEFNEMWGDTGLVPNTTLSKFGPFKTNNTPHTFTIGGSTVELYFSPSDGTNSRIINCINSANSQLYFGVYTFTSQPDADSIKNRILHGVDVAGIMDQFSQSYQAYSVLNPVMGNNLKVYAMPGTIYHSKFMIADPCDTASDPLVETGSHNWSIAADTKNDENALVIHDAVVANMYYQSFYQNFADLGGLLTPCTNTGIEEMSEQNIFHVTPNPTSGKLYISIDGIEQTGYVYKIIDLLGNVVIHETVLVTGGNNVSEIDISHLSKGIYLMNFSNAEMKTKTLKIVID